MRHSALIVVSAAVPFARMNVKACLVFKTFNSSYPLAVTKAPAGINKLG